MRHAPWIARPLTRAVLTAASCAAVATANAASLQLLGLTGEAWPGLDAQERVDWLGAADIGADGTIGVLVHLAGASVTQDNDTALFVRRPGASVMELAAREGVTLLAGSMAGNLQGVRVTAEGVVLGAGTVAEPRPRLWRVDGGGALVAYGEFGGAGEVTFDKWALAGPERFAYADGFDVYFPSSLANPVLAQGDPAPGMPGYSFQGGMDVQVDGATAGFLGFVRSGTGPHLGALYTSDLASGDAAPALRLVEGSPSRPGEEFAWFALSAMVPDALLFYGASADAATGVRAAEGLWRIDAGGTVAAVLLEGQSLSPFGRVAWVNWYMFVQAGSPSTVLFTAGLENGGVVTTALLQYEAATGGLQPLLMQGDPVAGAPDLRLATFSSGGLETMDYNEGALIGFVGDLQDASGNPAGTAAIVAELGAPPQVLLRTGSGVPLIAGADCRSFDLIYIQGGGDGLPGRARGMDARGEMVLQAGLDADHDGVPDTAGLLLGSPEGNELSLGCGQVPDQLFGNGFE